MSETTNLNGLDYIIKDRRSSGSSTYDGGAMGGTFTQYPSGMCHNRDIGWQESAFVAAKACQQLQANRYAEALEFIEAWGYKPTVIELTQTEIQSGLDRVRFAELLIKQLPDNHGGRNTWLLHYGT